MTGLLEGKVAVVTGAGGGLGRAHAEYLAELGASVVVNDVNADAAVAVAADIAARWNVGTESHTADISELEGGASLVATAVDSFGGLDIVVNNAGIVRDKMIFSMELDNWDAVVRVHGTGTFSVCRAAASYFRGLAKNGQLRPASIINTASEAGLFGNVGQANYTFAKGGIVGLSLTIHQELNRYGVRCNVICPRARTPMLENLSLPPAPDGALDPLDPRQVTPLVGYLASERSAPVSGQVFVAFGGQLHHLKPWAWGSSFVAQDRLIEFDDVEGFFQKTFEVEPSVPPVPRHAMSIDQWAQEATKQA